MTLKSPYRPGSLWVARTSWNESTDPSEALVREGDTFMVIEVVSQPLPGHPGHRVRVLRGDRTRVIYLLPDFAAPCNEQPAVV